MVCVVYVENRESRGADHSPRPHRNLPNSQRSNQSLSGHNPRNRNSAKKGGDQILSAQPDQNQDQIQSQDKKLLSPKTSVLIQPRLRAPSTRLLYSSNINADVKGKIINTLLKLKNNGLDSNDYPFPLSGQMIKAWIKHKRARESVKTGIFQHRYYMEFFVF